MPSQDYYAILGLKRDATEADIKKAFRRLAKKYHPDRNRGDKEAERRFKEVNEAHNVLLDKDKRAQYDRFGEARARGFTGGDFWEGLSGAGRRGPASEAFSWSDLGGLGSVLNQFFRRESPFGTSTPRGGPMRGEDVEVSVTIPFDTAVRGGKVAVSVASTFACKACRGSGAQPGTRSRVCPECRGTGTVQTLQGAFAFSRPCTRCFGRGKVITAPCAACNGSGQVQGPRRYHITIPRGVRNGQRIRLAGQGEPGRSRGPNGDLYVRVQVLEHGRFTRRGNDVHSDITISMVQAALGTRVRADTVGGAAQVTVPPGTQPGTRLRLKGRGVTSADGRTGDHYVTINVSVPQDLTDEQREILRKFAAATGVKLD